MVRFTCITTTANQQHRYSIRATEEPASIHMPLRPVTVNHIF